MNNVPDWCKKAAEEIERVPDCPKGYVLATEDGGRSREDILAAIIAKHADAATLPVAQEAFKAARERTLAVRELVEAAREAMQAEHSHNRDKFAHLRRALEPFRPDSERTSEAQK